MKNADLRIIWSADSHHYIIENGIRYQLSCILALQLNNYIKKTISQNGNTVSNWFHALDQEDRFAIKILHLN